MGLNIGDISTLRDGTPFKVVMDDGSCKGCLLQDSTGHCAQYLKTEDLSEGCVGCAAKEFRLVPLAIFTDTRPEVYDEPRSRSAIQKEIKSHLEAIEKLTEELLEIMDN